MSDQVTTARAALDLWGELASLNPWTYESGEPARIFLEVTAEGGTVTVIREEHYDLPEYKPLDAHTPEGNSFAVRRPTIYDALREVLALAQECAGELPS